MAQGRFRRPWSPFRHIILIVMVVFCMSFKDASLRQAGPEMEKKLKKEIGNNDSLSQQSTKKKRKPNVVIPADMPIDINKERLRFAKLSLDDANSNSRSIISNDTSSQSRRRKKKNSEILLEMLRAAGSTGISSEASSAEDRTYLPVSLSTTSSGVEISCSDNAWERFITGLETRSGTEEDGQISEAIISKSLLKQNVESNLTLAIVALVREPKLEEFESWIEYHRIKGFRHIFVFFDDPRDRTISFAQSRWAHETNFKVHCFQCDEEHYRKCNASNPRLFQEMQSFIKTDLSARQILACERGLKEAIVRNITWLVHLSVDQLLYIPDKDVKSLDALRYFETIENRVETIRFLISECIPNSVHVSNCFKEVKLFKRNPLHIREDDFNKFWPESRQRTGTLGDFFVGQSYGRSAVRVSDRVEPLGVNEFRRRRLDISKENLVTRRISRFDPMTVLPPPEIWGGEQG